MSNFLEVDPKLLENNFVISRDAENNAESFENLLRSAEGCATGNMPWKNVTPRPGCCVKTKDNKKNKVFINLCQIDELPEPKEITEEELLKLWQSEEASDYRIPLSIQEPHDELDKSGKPTVVYDVAVNTNFFKKIEKNMLWRSFVLQVIFEGVENKYDLSLEKEEFVILQNRKCLGVLRPHRIKSFKGAYVPPKRLIEELPSKEETSPIGDVRANNKCTPQFRLYENSKEKALVGEIHLPKIMTIKEISLFVGEDRLVVESRRGYSLDVFVPVNVKEDQVNANFNGETKILSVYMPIVEVN